MCFVVTSNRFEVFGWPWHTIPPQKCGKALLASSSFLGSRLVKKKNAVRLGWKRGSV